MAQLVRAAQLQQITRETGLMLVSSWRPRSVPDGVRRIRNWVRRHMRFINEPIETLHGGAWMLGQIRQQGFVYGDCDDASILAATLGLALGLPSRFVAVGPPWSSEFVHVFCEFSDSFGNSIPCDPTSTMGPPPNWDEMVLEI